MGAALVLAGGGAFWLAPGPASDGGGRDKASDWTLLAMSPPEAPEQAYQRLRQLQPWGKSAGPVAAVSGAMTANWRLRGVAWVVGGRPYALIEEGDGKASRYQVGETLPLGEKLLTIHADRIEIETPEAERRMLVLYQQETLSASGKGRKE